MFNRSFARLLAQMQNNGFLIVVIFLFAIRTPEISVGQILPFHYYTIKDGLPSNNILSLFQDSRGFLWIGTAEGISVYDGSSFTNYTGTDGLGSGGVDDIIEDRTSPGTMWIATYGGGVCKFDRGRFTTLKLSGIRSLGGFISPPSADFVNSLMQDHEGTIWCGADTGVFRLRGEVPVPFHPETIFRGVNDIVEVNDGTIWIAAEPGLFSYDRKADKVSVLDFGEPINLAQAACTDHEGNLWVGTLGGNILQIRDGKILRRFNTQIQYTLGWQTFFALKNDDQGNLWACTRFGLMKIPTDRMHVENIVKYTVENGLPDNTVRCLLIDRENNLWLGTQGRGIARLTEKGILRFSIPVFFSSANNSCGAADSSGHLWISPPGELWEFWRDSSGLWRKFEHRFTKVAPTEEPEIAWSMSYSRAHELWLNGSDRILYCFKIIPRRNGPSELRLRKKFDARSGMPTSVCFLVDRNNHVWLSAGEGVIEVNPWSSSRRLRTLTAKDGIPHTSIRAIFEDHNGNIWLGGGYGGGVAMVPKGDLRDGRIQRYTLNDGLSDDFIRSFGEDKNGRLLIGTRYGGLQILDHGKFTTYDIKSGLLSNAIWSIITDSTGKIILGTNLGIQILDEDRGVEASSTDELIGEQVASAGIFRTQYLWIATPRMLTITEYPQPARPLLPPPVYITSVRVNGEKLSAVGGNEFSYDRNNIFIQYVGISFRNERQNRYLYRLLENDKEWQPVTKATSVTYASLKPGVYRFEVKALNSDGVESKEAAAVTFRILSPVWLRWWFILLVNIFVLALIAIAYRYRLNQLMKIEKMRTRIASDLHDDIGSSLSRIALFSEVAKVEAAGFSPRMVEMAEKIGENARELLDSVGTLVWSIDPRHDRFDNLSMHLKNFAQEMFSLKGIDYTFTVDPSAAELELPLDARKNILLICKEAVNNIVKHANCKKVEIYIREEAGMLNISVADDGKGVGDQSTPKGHGVANMKSRAASIGGSFDIRSRSGGGTVIEFQLPMKQ